jgi:hypothetical protein
VTSPRNREVLRIEVEIHGRDVTKDEQGDHRGTVPSGAQGWFVPDVAGRLLMAVDCDVLIVRELIESGAPPDSTKPPG